MNASKLALADWFLPLGLDEFQRTTLGERPHLVAPRPELAENLSTAIAIRSINDVLSLRIDQVLAWFHMLDGRHTAVPVPISSGRDLYDAGMTLYVQDVPEFASHEREIAEAFSLAPSQVKCTLFCNRAEAVTRAHFDCVDLIVVQLQGRKTWSLAPNTFAPSPLESWATLDPVKPSLRVYAPGLPPAEMPAGSTIYELEPGSVLHVPRGYWHETYSDRDSLSLHVQLIPTLKLDVVLSALRRELARDPWWREATYGSGSHASGNWSLEACERLRGAASRLDALDLVRSPAPDAPISMDARFARCGQVSFGVDTVNPRTATARVVIVTHGQPLGGKTCLEMSPGFFAACRWIDGLPTGLLFGIKDLLAQEATLDPDSAVQLLRQMESVQLVRRVTTCSSAPAHVENLRRTSN